MPRRAIACARIVRLRPHRIHASTPAMRIRSVPISIPKTSQPVVYMSWKSHFGRIGRPMSLAAIPARTEQEQIHIDDGSVEPSTPEPERPHEAAAVGAPRLDDDDRASVFGAPDEQSGGHERDQCSEPEHPASVFGTGVRIVEPTTHQPREETAAILRAPMGDFRAITGWRETSDDLPNVEWHQRVGHEWVTAAAKPGAGA